MRHMGERRCRYCEKSFQPSKYQPQQEVCSEVGCQKQRRSEYRQQKLKADEEYRQVCRDSSRKWRSQNADYWRQYREKHPESVAQNREKQQARDRRQHLRDLANNTSALDVKHSAAAIWLLNGEAADLANNNSVSGKVFVIEALPRRKGPGRESCKQQPAGAFSAFAG
jgi:hypothetical protein